MRPTVNFEGCDAALENLRKAKTAEELIYALNALLQEQDKIAQQLQYMKDWDEANYKKTMEQLMALRAQNQKLHEARFN